MKSWFALASFFFLIFPALFCNDALAACDEACTTYADCAIPCPVCAEGFCVDCAALGDQTSCEDVGSGAAARCGWVSSNCIEIPEAPRGLLLLGFVAMILFLRILKPKLDARFGSSSQ